MKDEVRQWNAFVSRSGGSFLQSYEWGEFQRAFGRRVMRASGEKKGWQVQAFLHELPFSQSYLYVPRGPLAAKGKKRPAAFKAALERLGSLARDAGAAFIKVEPDAEPDDVLAVLTDAGFAVSGKEMQPKRTIVLDVTPSEQKLQGIFKPKTRYNIRLAIRHRVTVRKGEGERDTAAFYTLLKSTSERSRFGLHNRRYYEQMLSSGVAELFIAEHAPRGEQGHHSAKEAVPVAAALVNFFGERATYLHGGSRYEERHLMAPYLLHWRIIREAKLKKCSEYDFWGIDEKRWPGVTRFKEGWGGVKVELSGAWDLAVKPFWYRAYHLGASLRKRT
jgi:lipid II:glycine glycyltransferase (peptidoglycan interpeptide bridge formation enzyme)